MSFDEAATVFEDDEALLIPDPDHSSSEARFVLIGESAVRRILVVIHCEKEEGDALRIISARRADRQERATYARRRG